MKTCSKCKDEHPATAKYFGPDKRNRSGLQAQCRACDKDRKREYLETSKSKAYQKEYQKEYQQSDKFKSYQQEYRQSDEYKAYQKKYQQSDKYKTYQEKYRATVDGCLHTIYGGMTSRCKHGKTYVDKGIENLFESPADLIDYVTNELKVDPRGLDCHRPDNDGHYERGNIEFLTKEEHFRKHGKNFCGVAGIGQ